MAFNSSGVYTRIDNSFSNPVVGTTISPVDADTYFDDIDAALNSYYGTSTTSLTIGVGTKTFTTQANKLFGVGRFVIARSDANAANYMFGQVTSYSTTTLAVNVVSFGGSGTLSDWTLYICGARGGAGPISGIRQTFSTTTTDADPGAGTFRLNNATVASATAAYLDNLDASGGTVSSIIDKWDDSTTTTKGILHIEKEDDVSIWADFTVTGSVTDGTGYRKLTLSAGASNGTFVNGDAFRISFSRTGDKGTDGAVAGPGTTVDGEVVLFNGTTGNTLKRASQTGLAKLTSGVLSAATAGTDYYNPGGTDVAVADGGTGSSTAAGALTNLTARGQGKETIFIPAAAMISRTTNGPATGTAEMATNKIMVRSLDFDTTTQQFAQFSVWFPKSWNLGTVTFQPSFSQATTASGGVVFGLAGVAVSDGDALDVALGTAQTSTKTAGTANLEYQGPESSAITIAGTPAAGDRVIFQVNRTVADASDTLAQNARLHGVRLFFTTNAATDA